MAKWLMHAYRCENDPTHPGALHLRLDNHMFVIPPNEPFEVESDYYAHHIMAVYGAIYGIIELPTEKTRTGVTFDPDKGLHDAHRRLRECQESAILQYARIQMEDRVRNNLPTLPPTGFVLQSVRELGVNLQRRFGFTPLGWDREANGQVQMSDGMFGGTPQQVAAIAPSSVTAETEALRNEVASLKELVEALLNSQVENQSGKGGGKRGSKAGPETES